MKTLFLLLFILVGCEKSGTSEHTLFQAAPSIEGGVDFATLNSFILKPMCLRCHAWAGDEGQVQSRIVPGNPDASSLYVRMANGSMPQGGPAATSAQLDVVAAYINGPAGTNPVPTIELKPTYESLKVHLFDKSCTMCHNGESRRLDDFTQLDEIKDEISDIQDQLDFGTMPPLDDEGNPRAPVPTQEVLDTFRDWVVLGMPRS